DRAEEAMQESFASALSSWPTKGIPENPAAWIMTTAYRKLIDAVRKEQNHREKQDLLQYETEKAGGTEDTEFEQSAMRFPVSGRRAQSCCSRRDECGNRGWIETNGRPGTHRRTRSILLVSRSAGGPAAAPESYSRSLRSVSKSRRPY